MIKSKLKSESSESDYDIKTFSDWVKAVTVKSQKEFAELTMAPEIGNLVNSNKTRIGINKQT